MIPKTTSKSRIDYVFINTSFHYEVTSIKVWKVLLTYSNRSRMSNHGFLKFNHDMDKTKGWLGYWKFNVFYLENENYKKKGFRRIMFNINTSLSPTAAWELLKRNIKDYSINFANVHQSTNWNNRAWNKRNRKRKGWKF